MIVLLKMRGAQLRYLLQRKIVVVPLLVSCYAANCTAERVVRGVWNLHRLTRSPVYRRLRTIHRIDRLLHHGTLRGCTPLLYRLDTYIAALSPYPVPARSKTINNLLSLGLHAGAHTGRAFGNTNGPATPLEQHVQTLDDLEGQTTSLLMTTNPSRISNSQIRQRPHLRSPSNFSKSFSSSSIKRSRLRSNFVIFARRSSSSSAISPVLSRFSPKIFNTFAMI